MSAGALASLATCPARGPSRPRWAWPALGSEKLSVTAFHSECRCFCPAWRVARGGQEPAGYEAGGLGRAQGRQAVPALSWPSHIQEVSLSFPLAACAGPVGGRTRPVSEGQPSPDGGLALYVGADSSGCTWGVNPGQRRKHFCALCCPSSL